MSDNISSATITGSRIANDTITESNLDWSTFPFKSWITSNVVRPSSSETSVGTITVTPGTWLVFISGHIDIVTPDTDISIWARVGSVSGAEICFAACYQSGSNPGDVTVSSFGKYTATANTTIHYTQKGNGTDGISNRRMVAIRVG